VGGLLQGREAVEALERFKVRLKQFCLHDGEAIRQEGGAVPMWCIGQAG
jgi:hypothetical protein